MENKGRTTKNGSKKIMSIYKNNDFSNTAMLNHSYIEIL